MAINPRGLAAACLIGWGLVLLPSLPSSAQSDEKDYFIQDVKVYREKCDNASSGQTGILQQCKNEKAELTQRQHQLNLTDAEVDQKLNAKTRGGLRGGLR